MGRVARRGTVKETDVPMDVKLLRGAGYRAALTLPAYCGVYAGRRRGPIRPNGRLSHGSLYGLRGRLILKGFHRS